MTAPRPATVTYGTACLAVSLLIGVAILQYAWRTPRIALVCLVLMGGLIVLARRRGWPRWVIAGLAVVSVAATFPEVRFQLSYGGVISVATAVQLILELVGCVLLFHPRSTRWYLSPTPAPPEP